MVRNKELKIDIIRAKNCYASEISKIENQSFSQPWSISSISEALNNPISCFLLAMVNNVTVGYVGSYIILDGCYLTNIAVLPNFRRNGIAKGLMKALIKIAKQKKIKFLTLEVRETNLVAISLYELFDFKVAGKRKNFYTMPREDAIILTKFID